MNNHLIQVGKIHKAHGLGGAMNVSFEAFFLEFIPKVKALYLEDEGKLIPYFPESFDEWEAGNGALKFDEIHSKEEAVPFATKVLYADASRLEGLEVAAGQGDEWTYLLEYEVFVYGKSLGKILDILIRPGQHLVLVKNGNLEVMLPLTEEAIEKMDEDKKEIYFDLPENYLETFSQ